MAKNDNANQVSGEQVAPEQRDAEGNPAAAREGESALATGDVNVGLEANVNRMSPAEEAERQAAENYPRSSAVVTFDGHEEREEARTGHYSTSRANVGRVVVVDEDLERDGEVLKAGVHDLPVGLADSLISEGKAFEPAGKKKGR